MKQKTKDIIEGMVLIILISLLGTTLNYSITLYLNNIPQKATGLLTLAFILTCILYTRIKAIKAEFKGF